MNTVATNIRFPADQYEDLKTLAFLNKISIAQLIRNSIKAYMKVAVKPANNGMSLVKQAQKMSVKIGAPTLDLIRDGRRFE